MIQFLADIRGSYPRDDRGIDMLDHQEGYIRHSVFIQISKSVDSA